MTALDDRIIEEAVKNGQEWFKRPVDAAEARQMYNPILKPAKEGETGDKITPKVIYGDNGTNVYVVTSDGDDMQTEVGTPDDIGRDSNLCPIVSLGFVWFMSMAKNTTFGVTLTVTNALLWKKEGLGGVSVFHTGSTGPKISLSSPGSTGKRPREEDGCPYVDYEDEQ